MAVLAPGLIFGIWRVVTTTFIIHNDEYLTCVRHGTSRSLVITQRVFVAVLALIVGSLRVVTTAFTMQNDYMSDLCETTYLPKLCDCAQCIHCIFLHNKYTSDLCRHRTSKTLAGCV